MSDQRPLTFGEKSVGIDFNPSANLQVTEIKQAVANYIDILNDLRDKTLNGEVKRQLSVAITEAQSSQMWAVKALTWKHL